MEIEHIPIYEPIKDTKEFATSEDFNAFYQLNKDKMDKLTTCRLNKMYKIPGYRITKINGILSLKNIPTSKVTVSMRVDTLNEKVNEMSERLNKCILTINKVLDYLDSNPKYN